jgi:hypothetical protein
MQEEYRRPRKGSSTTIIVVVILVLAGAAAFYLLRDNKAPVETLVKPVAVAPISEPQAAVEPAPMVDYEPPAQPVEPEEPLPLLNESDSSVLAALKELRGEGLLQLVVPKEVLRKFVLAVNAVAEGKVVNEYRPLVSPTPPFKLEKFTVMIDGEAVEQERISTANFERYESYVTTLALIDSDATATMYRHFYPLLEEAFKELGLKKSNFHSVMIAAIDNILAAPDERGELLLVHPKVLYQFADPALENMPQTHKLMLRMGPENARSVKASLRQLRARLMAN